MTAHEVEALPVTHNSCLLFTQAEPPGGEKLPQSGEDDSFELPARTGQDHEVVGVTDQPEVAESRILSVPWFGPLTPVVGDQSQRPPAPVRVGPVDLRRQASVRRAGPNWPPQAGLGR